MIRGCHVLAGRITHPCGASITPDATRFALAGANIDGALHNCRHGPSSRTGGEATLGRSETAIRGHTDGRSARAAAPVTSNVVLVADKIPLLKCYDRAPLIQPILFKTAFYWLVVFVARLLERLVHFLLEGHPPATTFSRRRFSAISLWILVLFLIYVTVLEFSYLFGRSELPRLFFASRPSELQLNRRQRMRELLRLSRRMDAHPLGEFAIRPILCIRGDRYCPRPRAEGSAKLRVVSQAVRPAWVVLRVSRSTGAAARGAAAGFLSPTVACLGMRALPVGTESATQVGWTRQDAGRSRVENNYYRNQTRALGAYLPRARPRGRRACAAVRHSRRDRRIFLTTRRWYGKDV